ncbi:MAG TPA: hypothetical protein VJ890_28775 [Vineibacter sp.]|nr:hypothetical protein [Vineibacter sp.]
MAHPQHPLATHHLPPFITGPGETDVLYVVVTLVLIGAILGAGVFFFWLHSLPERMVHNRAQFDIVAVLALLSLFTHIHAFWVAALLLALVKIPEFSISRFNESVARIAGSLEKIANTGTVAASARPDAGVADPPAKVVEAEAKTASAPSSADVAEQPPKREA